MSPSRFFALCCATSALWLAACGGAAQPAQPSGAAKAASTGQPSQTPSAARTITIVHDSEPSPGDLVGMITADKLRSAGYDVQEKYLSQSDLVVKALIGGEADLGVVGVTSVPAAVQAGAPVRIVMQAKGNEWFLVTSAAVTDPKQLDGKRVGGYAKGSLVDALLASTEQKYGVHFQVLDISGGSELRAQALLKGQLDAAVEDVSNTLLVTKQGGGKYHLLVSYGEQLPSLQGSVIFTTASKAKADNPALADYLKTYLEVSRQVDKDPTAALQKGATAFKSIPADVLKEQVDTLIQAHEWDPNGNTNEQTARFTLDFMHGLGLIKGSDPQVGDYYDFTPLDKVLADIGRA